MIEPATFFLFCLAALALLVTPGPAVLYIVARSVAQGRRAGLVSCLGLTTGGLLHVVAAAAGLSALMMSSAIAFNTVKLLGAGYLIYLGVTTLISARQTGRVIGEVKQNNLWQIYRQGVVVNVLNPKAALFFFAFLPQFVTDGGRTTAQILFLGVVFLLLGMLTDTTYALTAGALGGWLRSGSRTPLAVQRYVSGGVYIGLGIAAAFGERPVAR